MTTSTPTQAYTQGTGTSGVNTLIHYDVRPPAGTDVNYKLGTSWIDTANNNEYSLTSFSSLGGQMTATWITLGGGTSDVNSLSGNTGGSIFPVGGNIGVVGSGPLAFSGAGSTLTGSITPGTSLLATLTGDSGTSTPTAGNIQIIGGSGVTTVASGSGVTINLDGGGLAIDSFTPDAGTSPVVPNGSGMVTMAGTANQITTTGGTNSLTLSVPSSFTAPGSITSTTTLTAGNGFNVNAGTVTVASGTSAIDISADAANTPINIGTGAGVKLLNLGSVNGVSASVLQAGTGGMGIFSTNSSMSIRSGTGILDISNDSVATNVTVANGAGNKTLSLGSINTTSTTSIYSGTGGITANSNNGAISVVSGTGALGISTDAAATSVSIANGAGAKQVFLGSLNTTSATTISAGSGNITMIGNVLKTTNPAFFAYLGTSVVNATGNATVYTLGSTQALTEIYDRGNNFNVNGTFTAPVTGIYDLRASIYVSNILTGYYFVMNIVTTTATYNFAFDKTAMVGTQNMYLPVLALMNAGDTARVNIAVNGEGADVNTIFGVVDVIYYTYFSGVLVA